MLTKSLVRKQLESLPKEFSLEDLVEQLILIQKIETGLKDSKENNITSEEALNQEIEGWFQ